MKMFVFEHNDQVSENYHSGGGLMVVAKDAEHVKELIQDESYIEITDKEWQEVIVYELKENAEPEIFVFPDAGCC